MRRRRAGRPFGKPYSRMWQGAGTMRSSIIIRGVDGAKSNTDFHAFLIALLAACFVIFSAPIVLGADFLFGKVVKVADGDTVTVLTQDMRQVKIRLYGVDCPEKKQAYGQRARQYTAGAVFGQDVQVEVMSHDRYGRIVGIVWRNTADGQTVNAGLLSAGLAWVYPQFCKKPICQEWRGLEQVARQERMGLWADPHAVPPWQFRKRKN